MKRSVIFLLLTLVIFQLSAQQVTQSIRGEIRDQDSRQPLIGANVIVNSQGKIIGAATDIDGKFTLENVPVGRVDIKVTYLGYEDKVIPNVVVGAGKQVVLEIELKESLESLQEIKISAQRNKSEVLNEMALSSARTFSVEETQRYAGSLGDPARMVSSFGGVTSDPEGDNSIIVRGNSPKGILWRLEGVEIPNPNHFSDEGSTGGPINALNSNMLANSDFYTGAFAPEYGNAYSGVFDMKLRTGNNEQREYTFSAGVIGIDATIEGPFSSGGRSSYLANYRYSSLAILDDLGIVDFNGIPKYQDASFKLMFPGKKLGTFTVFGLGGMSNIFQTETNEDNEDIIESTADYRSNMGVLGVNHTLSLSENTYIKNSIAITTNGSGGYYDELHGGSMQRYYDQTFQKYTYRVSSTYNAKLSARHKLETGLIYKHFAYTFESRYFNEDKDRLTQLLDEKGDAGLIQGFVSWKYRITEDLTAVSGLHYMHFLLNDANSVEPRASLRWQFTEKQALTAGFGVHGKVESLITYFAIDSNGQSTNRNLGLSKANHYVLGYENLLTKNLLFKVEAYYQHLYNIPVENNPEGTFSILNSEDGYDNLPMVNDGLGRNYGLEFTLERYFDNRYFFLLTTSLFESEYQALDGKWRTTRFNGNYVGNFLFGKEFTLGDPTKNKTLGISGKISYTGANPYTPVDLEKSISKGETVRVDDVYSTKGDNVFLANVVVYYRKERKKTTHEIRLDIQNVTNNQAKLYDYYNDRTQKREFATQLASIPVIYYKLEF